MYLSYLTKEGFRFDELIPGLVVRAEDLGLHKDQGRPGGGGRLGNMGGQRPLQHIEGRGHHVRGCKRYVNS